MRRITKKGGDKIYGFRMSGLLKWLQILKLVLVV